MSSLTLFLAKFLALGIVVQWLQVARVCTEPRLRIRGFQFRYLSGPPCFHKEGRLMP